MPIEYKAKFRHALHYITVASHAESVYLQGDPLGGLALFDTERGQIDAVWNWLLHQDESVPDRVRRTLLLQLADATVYTGELRYDMARERIPQLEAQIEVAQLLGNKFCESIALGNLGAAYSFLGNEEQAIVCYQQHLILSQMIGDRRGEGNALGNLGLAYAYLGEVPHAIAYYEQQLAIVREIGDRRGEGNALGNLGLA
jgi:tetratricopeptide (TPR) repeat protein